MHGHDKRIVFNIVVTVSIAFSEFRRPEENDILNYVHIVFE